MMTSVDRTAPPNPSPQNLELSLAMTGSLGVGAASQKRTVKLVNVEAVDQ